MDSLAPPAIAAPRLRCLLLCDLANSTGLIDLLGDLAASELIRRHDRLARELLQRHHGQEIDKTDGFLLLFERPVQAVAFALAYQRALAHLGGEVGHSLKARVGIHVGEVLTWSNRAEDIAGGAKPLEVEGLAKAVAARLMALALPGQILLSESAHTLALRARNELDPGYALRWIEHGRYRLHGVAAPMRVHEVGEADAAPCVPPPNHAKARRVLHWWQWKPLYAVLALAAIALPAYWLLQPSPAIAFAERDWVVVGNLRNLTGDARFDQSLDTAIRVGLEQSRHVNLVANLKTRDVLKLMRRAPETKVDREVGSEVAQRVGARALLLPSLAEVGGRMRFTAELVDPLSGATVYANSVEAANLDGVLPTIDSALKTIRHELGESLSSIEKSAMPLPAAVTANLDALRAFAQGQASESAQEFETARHSFELALALDPEFAAAHAGLARYWFVRGDIPRCQAELRLALADSGRITDRERLSFSALLASVSEEADHIDRWKALLELYPDSHAAAHNLATFLWDENQFEEAARYAAMARTPQSPTLTASTYVQAMVELALGRHPQAGELFALARAAGGEKPRRICASLHAALGEPALALRCFDALPPQLSSRQYAEAWWLRALLEREFGSTAAAEAQLQSLQDTLDVAATVDDAPLLAGLTALQLRALEPKERRTLLLQAAEKTAALAVDPRAAQSRAYHAARHFLAYLAISHGEAALAETLLTALPRALGGYQGKLREAVLAYLQASTGDHENALQRLDRNNADLGAPLLSWIIHTRVLAMAGRDADAAAAREKLLSQRPRALAEFADSQFMLGEYLAQLREWTVAGSAAR